MQMLSMMVECSLSSDTQHRLSHVVDLPKVLVTCVAKAQPAVLLYTSAVHDSGVWLRQ
jgi:hypothetical protein